MARLVQKNGTLITFVIQNKMSCVYKLIKGVRDLSEFIFFVIFKSGVAVSAVYSMNGINQSVNWPGKMLNHLEKDDNDDKKQNKHKGNIPLHIAVKRLQKFRGVDRA